MPGLCSISPENVTSCIRGYNLPKLQAVFWLCLQAAYGSVAQGFGTMPGSSTGYNPAAFAQAGMSPYGQSSNNVQSGQKRDSGYDQVSCLLCVSAPHDLRTHIV